MCLLVAKKRAVVAALLAGQQHANANGTIESHDCCLCTRHARHEANIQSGTRCTGKIKGVQGRSSQKQCGGRLTASKDWLKRQSAGRKARGQTSKQRACVARTVKIHKKRANYVKTSTSAIQHTTHVVTDAVSRVCPRHSQLMQPTMPPGGKNVPVVAASVGSRDQQRRRVENVPTAAPLCRTKQASCQPGPTACSVCGHHNPP